MSRKIKSKELLKHAFLKSLPTIAGFSSLIKCSQFIDKNGNSTLCVVVFDTSTTDVVIRYFTEEIEAALFIEKWV